MEGVGGGFSPEASNGAGDIVKRNGESAAPVDATRGGDAHLRVQSPEGLRAVEAGDVLGLVRLALQRNAFGPARELLIAHGGLVSEEPTDLDVQVAPLVKERLTALGEAEDGKHFVACVSFLPEYLRREDVPDKAKESEEIAAAVKDHVIKTVEEDYEDQHGVKHDFPDTQKVSAEIGKFADLELLDEGVLTELPEIGEIFGRKLLANFTKRSSDYAHLLVAAYQLGVPFEPEGQIRQDIEQLVLDWIDEDIRKVEDGSEDDPRKALVRLSTFMTDLGYLSEEQVRENPELLRRVRETLERAESYQDKDSVDKPLEETIAALSDTFGD
jgi:hypothetical protein